METQDARAGSSERPPGKDLLGAAPCVALRNGVQIPWLGLGTYRLRGEALDAAVAGAVAEGYGLIDSASIYRNEDEIRECLKRNGESGSVCRVQVLAAVPALGEFSPPLSLPFRRVFRIAQSVSHLQSRTPRD